jgi:hypothetical protein
MVVFMYPLNGNSHASEGGPERRHFRAESARQFAEICRIPEICRRSIRQISGVVSSCRMEGPQSNKSSGVTFLGRLGLDVGQADVILRLPAGMLIASITVGGILGAVVAALLGGGVTTIEVVAGVVVLLGWLVAVGRIDQVVLLRPWPSWRSIAAMLVGPAGAAGAAVFAAKSDGLDPDELVALVIGGIVFLVIAPLFLYAWVNRARLQMIQLVPAYRELGKQGVDRVREQLDAADIARDQGKGG